MSVISHIKKKEGVKSSDFQVFHSIVRVQNLKVDKIQGRVPEAFPKFWSFKGGTFLHGIGGAWCGSWQRRRLTNETQGLLKLTEFPCLPPPSHLARSFWTRSKRSLAWARKQAEINKYVSLWLFFFFFLNRAKTTQGRGSERNLLLSHA